MFYAENCYMLFFFVFFFLFQKGVTQITSGELTGSSASIRFRMSATRTDALPLALTFGMRPKEDCKRVANT